MFEVWLLQSSGSWRAKRETEARLQTRSVYSNVTVKPTASHSAGQVCVCSLSPAYSSGFLQFCILTAKGFMRTSCPGKEYA